MLQNTWYQIGRSIVEMYVRVVLKADIHQPSPLPRGAKIIAVNHPSTSDPAFVTVLTREQTTILIKETLFKVPLFGRSLRMAGHVPVTAGNGRAALEEGIRLLKAGRTLVIFPEGEISPEGGFCKAHTGVARLALATGAPVIPVGISLNHKKIRQVHTRVEGKLEMGSWYLHGPYAMTVGNPVTYEGSAEDHEMVRSVTGQIMHQIAGLSQFGHARLALRAGGMPQKAALKQARLQPMAPRAAAVTLKVPAPAARSAAPKLGVSTPGATIQVAWRGTWLGFKHSAQLVMGTAVFKAVESGLLMLLMYARHF